METNGFQIMGGPVIDRARLEPYRATIEATHFQTIERLHSRGGLTPEEIWCAVNGVPYGQHPDKEGVFLWLAQWLDVPQSANKKEDRLRHVWDGREEMRLEIVGLLQGFMLTHDKYQFRNVHSLVGELIDKVRDHD